MSTGNFHVVAQKPSGKIVKVEQSVRRLLYIAAFCCNIFGGVRRCREDDRLTLYFVFKAAARRFEINILCSGY